MKFRFSHSLTGACNLTEQIIWNIWIFMVIWRFFVVSCGRSKKRMGFVRLLLLFPLTIHFQESNCCKKSISRIYRSKRLSLNGRSGRKAFEPRTGLCQTDCPAQDVPTYRWFLEIWTQCPLKVWSWPTKGEPRWVICSRVKSNLPRQVYHLANGNT